MKSSLIQDQVWDKNINFEKSKFDKCFYVAIMPFWGFKIFSNRNP